MRSPLMPQSISQITTHKGLKYPLYAAPKTQGLRLVILGGEPKLGNLRPIANRHVVAILTGLPNFDGMISFGDPFGIGTYRETIKQINTVHGNDRFAFWAYDVRLSAEHTWEERMGLTKTWASSASKCVSPAPYRYLSSYKELKDYEGEYMCAGAAAVILRDPQTDSLTELMRVSRAQTQQQAAGRRSALTRAK